MIVTSPETEEVVPEKNETVEERVPRPKVVEVKPVQEVERVPLKTKAPAFVPPKPVVHQAKSEPVVDVPAVPKTPVPVIPAAMPVIDQSEPVVRDPAAPIVPFAPTI